MQLHKFIRDTASSLDFSGVILIGKEKEIIFHEAFGYADRANQIKNTLSTRFGSASGTKFLTALGIGKLIDQGKIDLETKLLDILPFDFPNYSKDITVHHLLTHTSGVFDYYDEELITDFDNFQVSIPWYNIENLEDYLLLFQKEEMKFEPGLKFSYSNTGYILLGLVIEVISKMKYRDYIQENIFNLCDMRESGFFAFNMLPKNTATGYIKLGKNEWKSNIYNLPIIGGADGGAFVTTMDILKLWNKFHSRELLSEKLTTLFCKPHVQMSENNTELYYGYGLYVMKTANEDILSFEGEDAGVGFYTEYNSSNDTKLIITANDSESYWEFKKKIESNTKIHQPQSEEINKK